MTEAPQKFSWQVLGPKGLRRKWMDMPLSSRRDIKFTSIAIISTLVIFLGIPVIEHLYFQPDVRQSENKAADTQKSENSSKAPQVENQCDLSKSWRFGLYCLVTQSKLLGFAESFSIVLAAWIFILRWQDRRNQAHREAWSLIDGARESETSGARIFALRELCEDKVSLEGLDADGADLVELNLKGANLSGASLRGTKLQGANLEGTILQKADLREAKLQGANLRGAKLQGANLEAAELGDPIPEHWGNWTDLRSRRTNLEGVHLTWANLQKADLSDANLQGADLHHAFLQDANLRGANLQDANLCHAFLQGAELKNTDLTGADPRDAHFSNAKNLTLKQLQQANNWENAKYDRNFCLSHPEITLQEDDCTEQDVRSNKEDSVELRLLELVYRLLVTKEIEKKQDLGAIRRKIAELISLIDSGLLVNLSDNPLIQEIMTAVENLITDEAIGDLEVESKNIRNRLSNLKDTVRIHDEASKRQQEFIAQAEELERQAEELERQAEELETREELEEPVDLKQNL